MEEQKQSTSSNYFKGLSRRDYIQKAHEIIQQEGIQAVSIRRLLRRWGAHQQVCTGTLIMCLNFYTMQNSEF